MIAAAAWFLLLSAHHPEPATAAGAQTTDAAPRVEVCSLALGDGCQTFAAADLDPTLRPSGTGQIAFVDPESGQLVTPTAEQLEELAHDFAFSEQLLGEAVEPEESTLPNGAVRLRFPGGFLISLEVRVKEPKP